MRTSQKQNILRHLLYGPLCGQEQDWTLGRRIPARIHELRGKGFPIEKRTCDQGHVHLTHQWEFYIDGSPSDFVVWCANCGSESELTYLDEPGCQTIDGFVWFPMMCDECGKGDWR